MLLYFWCWQKSLLLQNIQKSRNCLIMLCIHKIYNLFHFEKKKLKPSNTQSHFYFQKNLNVFNLNFLKFNFYIPTYSKLSFLNKCCLYETVHERWTCAHLLPTVLGLNICTANLLLKSIRSLRNYFDIDIMMFNCNFV